MINQEDISYLFKNYLGREPSLAEIDRHSQKSYYALKAELASCKERKQYMESIHGIAFETLKVPEKEVDAFKKIKIAFLISGHVRRNSVLEHIHDYAKIFDLDVFIFTWDNIGLKGTETNLEAAVSLELVKDSINAFPNVRKFKIENNAKYIESIKEETLSVPYFNRSSPELFIKSQLYAVYNSYKLMEEYAAENNIQYDAVFKLRFDLKFTRFNVSPRLIDEVNDNDIIFVPNADVGHDHPDNVTSCWACDKMYYQYGYRSAHIFEHSSIVCDVFAYGSQKSMKDYCSLFLHYDQMNREFYEQNIKSLQKNPDIKYTLEGNTHVLDVNNKGHYDSVYYFYCSYPERMLQKHLREYMLVRSENVGLRFIR
jgi:hypothetical protein